MRNTIVPTVVRPDVVEVLQLLWEGFSKWCNCSFPGASWTEEMNLAEMELKRVKTRIKYVERSEAVPDSIVVFMEDGTSYRIRVERTA